VEKVDWIASLGVIDANRCDRNSEDHVPEDIPKMSWKEK